MLQKPILLAFLVLLVALSGCSREKGARLFLYNDSDSPVRVQVLRENWSNNSFVEKTGVSVLVFPHSGKWLDQRLRHNNYYRLDIRSLQGRTLVAVVSPDLLEEAKGGMIRAELNGGPPRLTTGPEPRDPKQTKALQDFFYTVQFVTNFAVILYWSVYWYRRRMAS